jgi:hypothetical protein
MREKITPFLCLSPFQNEKDALPDDGKLPRRTLYSSLLLKLKDHIPIRRIDINPFGENSGDPFILFLGSHLFLS